MRSGSCKKTRLILRSSVFDCFKQTFSVCGLLVELLGEPGKRGEGVKVRGVFPVLVARQFEGAANCRDLVGGKVKHDALRRQCCKTGLSDADGRFRQASGMLLQAPSSP